MSELTNFLNFLLSSFISSDSYQLVESKQDNVINYHLKVKADKAGLIIGRQGKTINAIRRLLQIKAGQEKLRVYLQVESEGQTGSEDPSSGNQSKEKDKKEVSARDEKVEELSQLIEE